MKLLRLSRSGSGSGGGGKGSGSGRGGYSREELVDLLGEAKVQVDLFVERWRGGGRPVIVGSSSWVGNYIFFDSADSSDALFRLPNIPDDFRGMSSDWLFDVLMLYENELNGFIGWWEREGGQYTEVHKGCVLFFLENGYLCEDFVRVG